MFMKFNRDISFLGMIAAMDEGIGNVIQVLEENGMLENTLIIYTSDVSKLTFTQSNSHSLKNGANVVGSGSNLPFKMGKATMFEGGTRQTAVINYKDFTQQGTVYNG